MKQRRYLIALSSDSWSKRIYDRDVYFDDFWEMVAYVALDMVKMYGNTSSSYGFYEFSEFSDRYDIHGRISNSGRGENAILFISLEYLL